MTRIPFETRFYWPHSTLARDCRQYLYFKSFVQWMVNRLGVGGLRYGPARKTQRYHERVEVELKAYRKTGNQEHLINIANYALLEMQAPGVKDAYMDASVGSVTRGKFGKGGCVGK